MIALQDFLHMGGYATYVWSAYSAVFIFLLTQWFLPWRRWKNYLKTFSHE